MPEEVNEEKFQDWYRGQAGQLGLNPDPDDPKHHYDYRGAYEAGATPDEGGHWPSEFKHPDHPNRFVGGVDTMAKEMEKVKVPNELLTPEQVAWTKQFKEAKRIAGMSQMGMLGLREMLGNAMEKLVRLMQGKPESKMIELAGQPSAEEGE